MSTSKLQKEKSFIKDMFSFLSDKDIDNLFITSEDINIIITKVLDGSYKGLNFNIKEITAVNIGQKNYKKDLYYPELFDNKRIDACSGDINRNQSELLFNKIRYIKNKLNICKDHKVLEYQSDEKQKLYEELNQLNRKRALMILNKSLQTPGMIDLHGLYTKEALMFVSDYIKVYSPKEINLITGCEGNSQSLRPSVISFLRQNGYNVSNCESPYIKAIKKIKYNRY